MFLAVQTSGTFKFFKGSYCNKYILIPQEPSTFARVQTVMNIFLIRSRPNDFRTGKFFKDSYHAK